MIGTESNQLITNIREIHPPILIGVISQEESEQMNLEKIKKGEV